MLTLRRVLLINRKLIVKQSTVKLTVHRTSALGNNCYQFHLSRSLYNESSSSLAKISRRGLLRINNSILNKTPHRYISPTVALLIRPLTRIGALLFGRFFRKWWAKKTSEEKKLYIDWVSKQRQKIYGALGFFMASLFMFYIMNIEVDPLTGRSRFIIMTSNQQKVLGRLTFENYLENFKDFIVPTTHPAYKRLLRVVNRILEANQDLPQIKEREWTLSVIDKDDPNAYVLPGGNIFVHIGALKLTENDDQLAIIIAHEVAHVLLQHPIEQISRNLLQDILMAVPIAVVWALFPDLLALLLQALGINMFDILVTYPYSRKLENEADNIGLQLAAKACYDVRHAVVLWGIMRTLAELNIKPEVVPWLNTHPNHEDREKNLTKQLPLAIATRQQSGCPILNPADPIKYFNSLSLKEREIKMERRGFVQSKILL
ncbi:GSCOCG00002999001-RA-CDS [Cotesia congregata]|uniref:Metalloendopeptidase OMA1, mitochondrial n=1 Tax=Cotesia congregata TaxID=51543 RepID=A0A8J2HG03_COTCN|nr:GSCOCG00002999001-RA-CDS [Cotesia congregata]CAG5093835.1 Similar to OMA1: Metalloendopeptidase OMA1 [Cotesia congregata]